MQASPADLGTWDALLKQATSGGLTIVNPLPGRWIGDNKLCLAALSDPRFHDLFNAPELEAINLLIPFSRKAGDGVDGRTHLEGRETLSRERVLRHRGPSVHPGAETDQALWSKVVATALHEGWLVQ